MECKNDLCREILYSDASAPVQVQLHHRWNRDMSENDLHWHREFEFIYLLEGKAEIILNDNRILLQPSQCFFINANTMHCVRAVAQEENTKFLALHFPAKLLVREMSPKLYEKYVQPIVSGGLCGFLLQMNLGTGKNFRRVFLELAALDKKSFLYEFQCLSLVLELWRNAFLYFREQKEKGILKAWSTNRQGAKAQTDVRTKKILAYIYHNYGENISVDDIAAYANISRSECYRCMKHLTEKTPAEFINDFRIKQAALLLSDTDKLISDISFSCGFNNSSYFTKCFKRTYGMTPKEYRVQNLCSAAMM